MYTVRQIFERLARNELSQVGFGGKGAIQSKDYPLVFDVLNQSLLTMFTRFPLKSAEMLVTMVDGFTEYYLYTGAWISESTGSGTSSYVIVPTSDIIRVNTVYSAAGEELPINDFVTTARGVYFPQGHIMQVPTPLIGEVLSIVYQSAHPTIHYRPNTNELLTFTCDRTTGEITQTGTTTVDWLEQIVYIPATFLDGLCKLIASGVIGSMLDKNSQAISNMLLRKYVALMDELEARNATLNGSMDSSDRLERNGWE